MSINIKFDIDTTSAQGKVAGISQQVQQQQTTMDKVWNNVKTNYTYYNQLGSIVLNNLAKAAKGTAALSTIQGLQTAQTAIVGQIAVFQTAKQAAAAFATGNVLSGAVLSTISAMLQLSVASALAAAIESNKITSQAEEIRRQLDAYNV